MPEYDVNPLIELPSFAFGNRFCKSSKPDDTGLGRIFEGTLDGSRAILSLKIYGDLNMIPRDCFIKIRPNNGTSITYGFREDRDSLTVSSSSERNRSVYPKDAWSQVPPPKDLVKFVLRDTRRSSQPIFNTDIDFVETVLYYPEMLQSEKEKKAIQLNLGYLKTNPAKAAEFKAEKRNAAINRWIHRLGLLVTSINQSKNL